MYGYKSRQNVHFHNTLGLNAQIIIRDIFKSVKLAMIYPKKYTNNFTFMFPVNEKYLLE